MKLTEKICLQTIYLGSTLHQNAICSGPKYMPLHELLQCSVYFMYFTIFGSQNIQAYLSYVRILMYAKSFGTTEKRHLQRSKIHATTRTFVVQCVVQYMQFRPQIRTYVHTNGGMHVSKEIFFCNAIQKFKFEIYKS